MRDGDAMALPKGVKFVPWHVVSRRHGTADGDWFRGGGFSDHPGKLGTANPFGNVSAWGFGWQRSRRGLKCDLSYSRARTVGGVHICDFVVMPGDQIEQLWKATARGGYLFMGLKLNVRGPHADSRNFNKRVFREALAIMTSADRAVKKRAHKRGKRRAAIRYKTVTLRRVGSNGGHGYDVKTVVPRKVHHVKTVVHKPANPAAGAAIICDKVGLGAWVDTKSSSAKGFLKATAPPVTHVRSLGHGIRVGESEEFGTAFYVYAVRLRKHVNFSLTGPAAAIRHKKLDPIIRKIMGHAKYVGEVK